MTRYAEGTEVSSEKSRSEIERTLTRYGADQFMYGWQENSAVVAFRKDGRMIRFILPLPDRNDDAFWLYRQGTSTFRRVESEGVKRYEQAVRQKWRALALVIKAKLEAIESGISTFEDEFMANIVLPGGETVGEWMKPQIAEAYRIGAAPRLLPMLPAPGGEG